MSIQVKLESKTSSESMRQNCEQTKPFGNISITTYQSINSNKILLHAKVQNSAKLDTVYAKLYMTDRVKQKSQKGEIFKKFF